MDVPQTRVAVTGSFGYSGKYITRRLLQTEHQVLTLTGNPHRPNPFGEKVKAVPFHFDQPEKLTASLKGVTTLYNTYWVRFDHGRATYDRAVENTRILVRAAAHAGVRRIVHVSITNPSERSPLPYFHGKALLEADVRRSGMSYAILRPTVIFGAEDILINNIAYLLRRFPVFAIPGDGSYRLQPVFVEDMAEIAVRAGDGSENFTLDVVGPKIFTFTELVKALKLKVGSRARLVHLAPGLALTLARLLGVFLRDVVLTREEVSGLMADLLISADPPTGHTSLLGWLDQNRDTVGAHYASELGRHYR